MSKQSCSNMLLVLHWISIHHFREHLRFIGTLDVRQMNHIVFDLYKNNILKHLRMLGQQIFHKCTSHLPFEVTLCMCPKLRLLLTSTIWYSALFKCTWHMVCRELVVCLNTVFILTTQNIGPTFFYILTP